MARLPSSVRHIKLHFETPLPNVRRRDTKDFWAAVDNSVRHCRDFESIEVLGRWKKVPNRDVDYLMKHVSPEFGRLLSVKNDDITSNEEYLEWHRPCREPGCTVRLGASL